MISAIVLAAGESTRFGRCKQLVPLGGKTLLEHVIDNVAQSDAGDLVVVLGAHAEEIRRRIDLSGKRVVVNSDYARGMSTSIQAGLRALSDAAEAAMIVLGDQPFVAPATMNRLIAEYRRTRAAAVVPTYHGGRGNPVIIDRALFGEMMDVRGDVGFRAILDRHAVTTVAVDDRGVIRDIDTTEDLCES